MPEITPDQLLLFAGFILPGAISMYVYGLKVPQREFELKDRIVEAICFSMLNFVVVWLPIQWVSAGERTGGRGAILWGLALLGFIVLPALWPIVLVRLLQVAERHDWIAVRAKTAWDDFFSRQRLECWLQVELSDGRVLGGRYGKKSFASSWPDPGHLFVEEVWGVDGEGYFTERVPGTAGVLLRPNDYKLIRVYEGVPANG